MAAQVDRAELEGKVKAMYKDVAEHPEAEFHFEMGRAMAERLGYRPGDLDQIPAEAIDSFAGVGYYFHLLDDLEGARVLDLGSGSGMDTFVASLLTGPAGTVIGLDMTDSQRAKAEGLRRRQGVRNLTYVKGYIDAAPFEDGCFDVVISNGVINLAVDKPQVFQEIARLLRPGGKLALADIVTDVQLPENITCNTTLWAACIGGAWQAARYRDAIETAGLHIVAEQINDAYRFLSDNAQGATKKFGVKSISLRADKV
ncbi:MAG: methyltransferase domain-containing protein [Burkholderiales bacterium]|uniref:Arsenite methyltransferase n=1 Tax=Ottowia pentelensis TaxID=511108 RepID=A0ABV6PTF8_9BURK|nr:methyltransferase domain-containing protein [Burkholderiales bacterium]MBS0402323.1 methyltransferase domain-containing protein [Pseudomonadota bacterium]MBS0413271.1 methyltransferase domain-containing protein [Pseudomonadota bacterium]